jgi:DDE superfamily endonuclease
MLKHFFNFQRAVRSLRVPKYNIYNFDETGFRIGCLSGQLVFTRTKKQVYISDPDNRELVTSMECICADGSAIQPMIIIAGCVMKEKHFMNNLDDDVLLAVSETGYTNDMLSYQWLEHFNDQTEEKARGQNRLLVMDGHGSHLTKEFMDFYYKHKICPFLLPPHSTHLLQPLDVGVFQSFKHYHQELLEDSIRFGGIDYKKDDFLFSFQQMRNLTFRPHIISRAWKLAGLVPSNPQIVLRQMEVMSTPEPELEFFSENFLAPTISFNDTPKTLVAIEQYSSYINTRLASAIDKTIELSPSVARAVEKRDKGSRIMLFQAKLVEEQLEQRKEIEAIKASRRARGNKQVQKYGVIRAGDARLRMIARDEAEDRRIELYNIRQEEKEEERRAVADRKEERLQKRQAQKIALNKRLIERAAKAKAKEEVEAAKVLEKARKKAEREDKTASRLASTQ